MNKLWLIKAVEGAAPWEPWYDKCFGMVIEAADEQSARKIATKESTIQFDSEVIFTGELEDYPDAWMNPDYSTCVELIPCGESRVILGDQRYA